MNKEWEEFRALVLKSIENIIEAHKNDMAIQKEHYERLLRRAAPDSNDVKD
jgi:hypothetical protein